MLRTNHRRKVGSLIASAVLIVCCGSAGAADHGSWPTSKDVVGPKAGFSAEGLAALDAKMKQAVDKGEVAGVETLLVHHGKVAQFDSHGVQTLGESTPISENTVFRIYSMTKPTTGVAMMQLYEKGLWKLDDPVTKFVPELAHLQVVTGKDADGKPVLADANRPPTMKEIMSHTAGFGYGIQGGNPVDDQFVAKQPLAKANLKEMIDTVATIPLLFQPGQRWSYSIAVDIQGLIVERLSGEKFGDYLKKHIFEPLSMNDTAFSIDAATQSKRLAAVYQWDRAAGKLAPASDPSGPRIFPVDSGGGGLYSTMHDYARFCQMLVGKGTFDGKTIIKPESVALMTQNHIGDLKVFGAIPGTGFGLDFAVVTDPAALHSQQGEGSYWWFGIAGTWFWIDPKNDLFYVGMIQRRGGATPDAVNFRNDSIKLVYEALQPGG
jgi:CubicO group peptidase (beta-lactamase class C family)